MSNKTRKHIWPGGLVLSLAIVGFLAAFMVLAGNPATTDAHSGGPAGSHCTGETETFQDIHDDATPASHPKCADDMEPNQAPMAGTAIPAQSIYTGGTATVQSTITDADADDTLTWAWSSDNTSVATVEMDATDGSMATVTAVGAGMADITVTATDPDDASAMQTFTVTVMAPTLATAPQDFDIEALDNGARLSWEAPATIETGYEVVDYQFKRTVESDKAYIRNADNTDWVSVGNVHTYRDLGLSYETFYYYQVRAMVKKGDDAPVAGAASEMLGFRTADSGGRLMPLLDPPTAVRMLDADAACANSITVSWQEPADLGTVPSTDDNGVYDGPDYIGGEGAGKEEVGEGATSVTYMAARMVDDGDWIPIEGADISKHANMMYMYVDTNVDYGHIYKYRVRAMNGQPLYGPWTTVTVDLTEEPPAPNQPRSLNVDPVGNTVELQWGPPVGDATPLLWRTQADFDRAGNASGNLDYVIERQSGNGGWSEIHTQDHLYADNFDDTLTQGYTDAAPPLGSVSYRVAALVDSCNLSPYNQKDPVDVINQAPVGQAIADQSVTVGSSVTVNTSFTDADQATLDYTVTSSNEAVATAEVSDMGVVTVTGVAAGSATIRVTATDSRNESASQPFTVTVRQAGLGMASNINIGLNTGGVIQVTWDAADNAAGYIVIAISQSDNSAIAGAVNPGVGGALPTALNLAGLTSGESYFVYIAATGASGDHTLSIPPADVTAN